DDGLRGAKQDLGATRRRHEPPAAVRAARRVDCLLHVLVRRFLEYADEIVVIRGITVLEHVSGNRGDPGAVNKVVVGRSSRSGGTHSSQRVPYLAKGCNTGLKASVQNGLRHWPRWHLSASSWGADSDLTPKLVRPLPEIQGFERFGVARILNLDRPSGETDHDADEHHHDNRPTNRMAR